MESRSLTGNISRVYSLVERMITIHLGCLKKGWRSFIIWGKPVSVFPMSDIHPPCFLLNPFHSAAATRETVCAALHNDVPGAVTLCMLPDHAGATKQNKSLLSKWLFPLQTPAHSASGWQSGGGTWGFNSGPEMIVGVGWSVHTCVILENLCHCKNKTLTDKITESF